MKIPTWLLSLFNKALAAFKGLFNAAFPVAKQIIIGQLRQIAEQAVQEFGNIETLTNAERREAAFKRIEEYSKLKGIETRDHLIYLAIEMAVSALKERNEEN